MTKLNNYEEKYKKRIEETRREEHDLLRYEMAFWASSLVATVTSPMMAAAATFATYVMVSDAHVLTAARTFTVLLLFIALRFPISYFGRLIGRAAQAMEAVRRLESFLNRPIRGEDNAKIPDEAGLGTSTDDTSNEQQMPNDVGGNTPDLDGTTRKDDLILSVHNAAFLAGTSAEAYATPDVKNMDVSSSLLKSATVFESSIDEQVSLRRGSVLALVGPVGSGKSTVVNGIIGEVTSRLGTKVSMNGRVSYVSQTPFILNATVRENIVFGLDFQPEWYEKVLDACCLRQDLEHLGVAGDLTEIGERGVTLSGGKFVLS